uniref:RING-type E3 ubiquitin transferase n=1 Tax=Chrysemys picta bellii TaxID=8478 RepID=A0A8C3FEC7_CHRPI
MASRSPSHSSSKIASSWLSPLLTGGIKGLQEAVICSICLAYFNDPVILKCGHNFCRACITQYCKESKTSPRYSCPQCKEPFREGEFQPNWQLRNVVEIAKKIPEPEGEKACEKHKALLQLFCEVDQTLICVVCRESRSHKDHAVLPLDEAAQDYQPPIATKAKPVFLLLGTNSEPFEDFEKRERRDSVV